MTITGDPESANGATWTYQNTIDGIVYDLAGILFKPAGTGPFSAVIISHGGGGNANTYSKNVAKEMVGWGQVCVAANLCHAGGNAPVGSPGNSMNGGASTQNIQRNMKCWDVLASLGYVDTNCIAAHGHSLGAMATGATVGTNPSKFAAASHTAGGVNDNGPQYIKTPQANGITTPYLLHQGDADAVVSIAHARKMDTILTTNGVIHRLDVYPGYSHSQISLDDTMFARTKAWYAQYLCLPTTGTSENPIQQQGGLTLATWPNPASGIVFIEFSLVHSSVVTIDVFNLLGEKVLDVQDSYHFSGKHSLSFDLAKLESGMYFITIKTASGYFSKKLIVKK